MLSSTDRNNIRYIVSSVAAILIVIGLIGLEVVRYDHLTRDSLILISLAVICTAVLWSIWRSSWRQQFVLEFKAGWTERRYRQHIYRETGLEVLHVILSIGSVAGTVLLAKKTGHGIPSATFITSLVIAYVAAQLLSILVRRVWKEPNGT